MTTEQATAGVSAAEILDLCRTYTLYEWTSQNAVAPIPFVRARGVYLWDAEGKRYLDFNSQAMNVNIGHADPRVAHAIGEQLAELPFIVPQHATAARGLLGRELARITPPGLNKAFFTNAGADANEAAIRMARLYTGRHKILTRYRSYHGGTQGVLYASGDPRRFAVEEGMSGVVRILDPYAYRSPLMVDDADLTPAYMRYLEEVIQQEGPHTIAAILLEPITGSNGIIVPPDGWMRGVRELCDRYGILLIADEVMSGFGRTGKWFAIDHEGVAPDLMSIAKGLTSGYVPLGAVMVSDRVAEHFETHPLVSGADVQQPRRRLRRRAGDDRRLRGRRPDRERGPAGRRAAGRIRRHDGAPPVDRGGARPRPVHRAGVRQGPRDARAPAQRRAGGRAAPRQLPPPGGHLRRHPRGLAVRQPAAVHHGGRTALGAVGGRPRPRHHGRSRRELPVS